MGVIKLSKEMSQESEEFSMRHLLDVGRALTRELDQRALLDRVLETAREITGALRRVGHLERLAQQP